MSLGNSSKRPLSSLELYRTKALTSSPCLTNSSARWLPINPPAPVTNTFATVHLILVTRVGDSYVNSLIHGDISLIRFVIPGLTRNPVFFWIPALAGMTAFAVIKVAVYNFEFVNQY